MINMYVFLRRRRVMISLRKLRKRNRQKRDLRKTLNRLGHRAVTMT